MMPTTDDFAQRVTQWLLLAEEDLLVAEHTFTLKDVCPFRLVAYHAQQCAEKYLKAYLVFKNIDFPYTHNISLLLELSSPFQDWLTSLSVAKELTFYAISSRYPGDNIDIGTQEARRSIDIAQQVRSVIRETLAQEGFSLPDPLHLEF
jgi:HEPN domain-containing protein